VPRVTFAQFLRARERLRSRDFMKEREKETDKERDASVTISTASGISAKSRVFR